MSTNPNTAGDLQNQYTNDWAAFQAAEAQEKADNAAYAAGLAGIAEMVKNHDSPDEILAVLMGLISGHGLSAQEDQVAVTSAEINVNSDLGAIANDMQNQLNNALSARYGTGNIITGGMNAAQAAQMQADYNNLNADIAQQEAYLKTNNLPIPPALKSMQDALTDLNNQTGGLLAGNNPQSLATYLNTLVVYYSGGSPTMPPNDGPTAGPLSSLFSDIATVKQQLGSLSTPLNAETQYETQQISTVETFLTNLSKELAQLTKTFVTNSKSS